MLYSTRLNYLLGAATAAASIKIAVPPVPPTNASKLNPAPVGASFEFFMWPSYATNVSLALPCVNHLTQLYDQTMPIRIGGTTQDRAVYDADFDGYVSYSVDDPLEAPMVLHYGPRFLDLIEDFGAETILGLNRANNDRKNTFSAALEAKSRIVDYLAGIELGNEPDIYLLYWDYPVATPPWNETQEGNDAADWAQDFINHWDEPLPILGAAGYAIPFPIQPAHPNLPYLVNEAYNQSVKDSTAFYMGHLYAFSNASETGLGYEMQHQRTVADLDLLPISTAYEVNRPYVLSETGFHGLDFAMDATFGAAIQAVDKTLYALSLGIDRLFYHQGTIDQAFFNWWKSDRIQGSWYGGYFGALAVAGGESVVALDEGSSRYAQYVVYNGDKQQRIILINTDYYSGIGTRSETTFTLNGVTTCGSAKGLRMTAPSSETTIPLDQTNASILPTIGGQYFSNEDCGLVGKQGFEDLEANEGTLEVTLKASEALIIYL